jgi:hypothetical protein
MLEEYKNECSLNWDNAKDVIQREYADIFDKLEKFNSEMLMQKVTKMLDICLKNLVSKRQIIRLPDQNGDSRYAWVSLSQAGIGIKKYNWRYYGDKKPRTFDYIPSQYYYAEDKYRGYKLLLPYWKLFSKYIHKQDKKKILRIAGFFMEKSDLDVKDSISETIIFKTPVVIDRIGCDSSKKYLFPDETDVINKVEICETLTGIKFVFNDKSWESLYLLGGDLQSLIWFHQLMQMPEIARAVHRVVDKIVEKNIPQKELITKLEQDLSPYLALEML